MIKFSIMNSLQQYLLFLSLANIALSDQWQEWKQKHEKFYEKVEQESSYHKIWNQNYQYVKEHNRGDHSFKLGLNEFADMTHEEFKQIYLQKSMDLAEQNAITNIHNISTNISWPSNLDWRLKGFVSDIQSQGRCSASWAFSAIGVMEGQVYKSTRKLVSLSTQQLLDCSSKYGNKGCYSGVPIKAFQYIKEGGGICSKSEYPYLGYVYYCAAAHCSKICSWSSYTRIVPGCESCLLDATYNIGPISVIVDASSISFQYYTSGIYCESDCNQSNLNHAMLVVGYGTDYNTGNSYWILKNSWGKSWGRNGYMYLARNENNMCGIATAASYMTYYN